MNGGSQKTGLVYGIDVSNYQPEAATAAGLEAIISKLDPRPGHVVVRLALSVEKQSMRDTAVAQLQAAVACGATAGGYVWGYKDVDPAQTVRDGLALAQQAGVTLPVLWLDLEDSPGPSIDWAHEALTECARNGVRGGIYSGVWWLQPHFGNTDVFNGELGWLAAYDGNPTLNTPGWGGLQVVAHQYADKTPAGNALDMDCFDASVI